jgi:hypothetical protein
MQRKKWLPKKSPYLPPDYDEEVIYAVIALTKGVASDAQQMLVWKYIMYLSGASEEFQDLSYRPGNEGQRDTDFAEGKRFVGIMLRKLLLPELIPENPDGTAKPLTRRMVSQRLRRQRERMNKNG